MNDSAPLPVCPRCSAVLATADHGLSCIACLYEAALEEGPRVGHYELLSVLDRGGTGVVHLAAHVEHDGLVALKIIRQELASDADLVAAFRNGLRIQHALRGLPNIAGMDELGTSARGEPYGVMRVLLGGTLAGHAAHYRKRPRLALELVVTLARAVHRAHQRGVLHCDLKPDNVLFNEDDEPFVTDFGFAHVLESPELVPGTEVRGGTRGWMSPEQFGDAALTTATDVFSLGALLFWLLSGDAPFGKGQDFEARAREQPSPRLHPLYRGPARWELDQICSRALAKQPEQRYASAAALADDVERVLRGEPIEAERRMLPRRAFKWMRRHQLATVAVLELALLVAWLPLIPLSVVGEVRENTRDQLTTLAQAQASAVIGELRAHEQRLLQLAHEPAIGALVDHFDPYDPPAVLAARGFDGLSVFTRDCVLRARWPMPWLKHARLDFMFRDYCRGQVELAQRRAREVYVARTFHSTGDEEPMLGISTPLYEGDELRGVLVGRTRARGTFGALHMSCGKHSACSTALLGPRDRDSEAEPMPSALYVLAAPGLSEGRSLMLDAQLARRTCKRLPCAPKPSPQLDRPSKVEPLQIDDYIDPITGARAMAALAPVGGTGLIAVVSTSDNALASIGDRMTERLEQLLWIQVALGCGLLLAAIAGRKQPFAS